MLEIKQPKVVFPDWNKRWVSASKLDLAELCPASCVLPQYETPPTDSQRRSRFWGKAIHKWVETGSITAASLVEEGGVVAGDWLAKGLEKKLEVSGVRRSVYWGSAQAFEGRFVWDPDTDTVGVNDTKFPDVPGSLRAIVDVIHVDAAEEIKTGHFPPPVTSLQIAAACLVTHRPVGILTHWERYPLNGRPQREEIKHNIGNVRDSLLRIRDKSYAAWLKVKEGTSPEVNPGFHCNQCNARPGCPAHRF